MLVRIWSPGPFTIEAIGPVVLFWRLIAAHYPSPSWKANCSATKGGLLPVLSKPGGAAWRWLTTAHFSLMKLARFPPRMQVSLLRVLEEKSFLRLGGSQPIASDFRLISATHRDLPSLIKENQFRDDFYYRINVIGIDVPPLCERLDDIPVLANHFLKRYVEETGKSLGGFTQKALDLLTSYHWPGNITGASKRGRTGRCHRQRQDDRRRRTYLREPTSRCMSNGGDDVEGTRKSTR